MVWIAAKAVHVDFRGAPADNLSMESKTTIDKVKAARAADPQIRAADIARQIGLSRERVRQALVALGLPTRVRAPRPGGKGRRTSPFRYGREVAPKTVSAVCEMQVCADLLLRGAEVFRNVLARGPVVLVADFGGRLVRVQVRAAKAGTWSSCGKFDVVAAVADDGNVVYVPDVEKYIKKGRV